jgi:hypothetical protein
METKESDDAFQRRYDTHLRLFRARSMMIVVRIP